MSGKNVRIEDLIQSERIFLKEYDNFCIHNNVKQVLDYYGIENSWAFIDTVIGVNMSITDNDINKLDIKYNIDTASVLDPFLSKVKAIIPNAYQDEFADWDTIKEKVEKGIPVITMVDVFYLKYLPYYLQANAIHSVILCGYSDELQEVCVVDWYEPYFYKGTLKYEDFMKARASENPKGMLVNSDFPILNKWIEIEKDGWEADFKTLLRITIDKMQKEYYSKTSVSQSSCDGIGVLYKLKEIINDMGQSSEAERKKLSARLHGMLFLMPKYRMFFAGYIERALGSVTEENCDYEIEVIGKGVSLWNKLLKLIVKFSLLSTDALLDKIKVQFDEILENEKECIHVLDNIKHKLTDNW